METNGDYIAKIVLLAFRYLPALIWPDSSHLFNVVDRFHDSGRDYILKVFLIAHIKLQYKSETSMPKQSH